MKNVFILHVFYTFRSWGKNHKKCTKTLRNIQVFETAEAANKFQEAMKRYNTDTEWRKFKLEVQEVKSW